VGGADINRGWMGGEFTPANRLPASDQSSARTKRYSSQRLRNVAADAGMSDTALASADNALPTSLGTVSLVNVTSMVHMPSRPVPSSAYYGIYIHTVHHCSVLRCKLYTINLC